jgi:hypothetical protein
VDSPISASRFAASNSSCIALPRSFSGQTCPRADFTFPFRAAWLSVLPKCALLRPLSMFDTKDYCVILNFYSVPVLPLLLLPEDKPLSRQRKTCVSA